MRWRWILLLTVAVLVTPVVAAGTASAKIPDRSGALGPPWSSGQRAAGVPQRSPVTDDFTILGHVRLPGKSPDADVFFYDHGGDAGKFAYVGTWSGPCSANGVKIIDVNDPAAATVVAFANPGPGVSTEDMVVRRIGARDVLAVGVQVCGEGGRPGVAFFDVTDPTHPTQLSFSRTPFGGVHELDVVVRPDGQVLALLAVPFVEFGYTYFGGGAGGDLRIVDITDPENPVRLATWGIVADSTLPRFDGEGELESQFEGSGEFVASYDHSVRAADDGMTAYASFWDAGVLKFDITDPAAPVLVGRTTYALTDEGNAHSLTTYDVGGERFVLQNDEDAGGLSPAIVTSSATGTEEFGGIDEFWMPVVLSEVGPLTGSVFDAGDGCEATDFQGAAGMVALVDTVDPYYEELIGGWEPPCRIGRQVNLASDADVSAFLSNLVSPDSAWPFPFRTPERAGELPAVQISDVDGLAEAIRGALAGGEVTVTLTPTPPSYGFLRVYQESAATDLDGDGVVEFTQVGAFSDLPHVTGELAPPPGDFGIHNTEVLGDRGCSAWYSHGIVALDLSDPTAPVLRGQFVPRASAARSGTFGDEPFPIVWGVAIDPETGVIYASDMRSGLWIVQPQGDALPGP